MSHTAGPWTVFEPGARYPGIEAERTKQSIVIFGIFANDDCGVRGRTPEETLANARLIAAAPDLLAALRAWEFVIRADYVHVATGVNQDAVNQLHKETVAAIAKAEGRT